MGTEEIIALISAIIALISLFVSIFALVVSVRANRLARKTGTLGERREAINLVRTAFGEVAIRAHIDSNTTSNVREAYHLAKLVFSKKVSDKLGELSGLSFELEHTRERQTPKYLDDQHRLGTEIQTVLKKMQSEAALNKS